MNGQRFYVATTGRALPDHRNYAVYERGRKDHRGQPYRASGDLTERMARERAWHMNRIYAAGGISHEQLGRGA